MITVACLYQNHHLSQRLRGLVSVITFISASVSGSESELSSASASLVTMAFMSRLTAAITSALVTPSWRAGKRHWNWNGSLWMYSSVSAWLVPVLCRAVSLVTGLPPLLVSLRDAHGVSDTQILGLVTHVSHLTPFFWLVKNLSHYQLIGQLYFCHAVTLCLSDLNLAPRIPPKPKPLLTLH